MSPQHPENQGKPVHEKLPTHPRSAKSIRYKLLLAINAVAALGIGGLLVNDYRTELSSRYRDKRNALNEEAQTLLAAIDRLRHHGVDTAQDYIDDVCSRMQEVSSPGHHIAAQFGDILLQAQSHLRGSIELVDAMKRGAQAPNGQVRAGAREIIVGSAVQEGLSVYVSEYLAHVRQSVQGRLLWRMWGFLLIGAAVTVMINIVLLHMVTRPLTRLVATVRQIGAGGLGAQTQDLGSRELNFLAQEINTMSATLAQADREQRQQMTKAQRIQARLQPASPNVPGLRIARLYEPATGIAGDYYDVLPLDDGTWLLVIADVTGHGVPAAMGAAVLKALLLTTIGNESSPGLILHAINKLFFDVTLTEDFASMLLIRWDPGDGRIEYASAGHEPGYLLSADGAIREVGSTGAFTANFGLTPMAEKVTTGKIDRGMKTAVKAKAILGQINEAFGMVPNFFKAQAAVDPDWLELNWNRVSKIMLAPGALDRKTKELIALTVSLVNHCEYCSLAHETMVLMAGASEKEIDETKKVIELFASFCAIADSLRVPCDIRPDMAKTTD